MPPSGRRKKDKSKSRTAVNRNNPKIGKKSPDDSVHTSTVDPSAKSGLRIDLRSRPSAEVVPAFEDNPESILRRKRAPRKPKETEPTDDASQVAPEIATYIASENTFSLPIGISGRTGYSIAGDTSAAHTPTISQRTDPEEAFNRSWGYLPPLDEEALAIIEAIIADPEMAKSMVRICADHILFPNGLRDRNVLVDESEEVDPQSDRISRMARRNSLETDEEKESHSHLWQLDQAKCNKSCNEALFQRTIMMGLIARHRLIYTRGPAIGCLLDFSVEELWICPPMPTRAYRKRGLFLSQPKPDLAVCFQRKALIPDPIWNELPNSIKNLACYEGLGQHGSDRAFHFLTIEAKKSFPTDLVGKFQSLNNASQSLHNMFEFLRDAGSDHEREFFAKVRFFSAVATPKGIVVRIHRPTRANGTNQGLIEPRYPLMFEFKQFCYIPADEFQRGRVLEAFEKILLGYGVKTLHPLLQGAAEAIAEKLRTDDEAMFARGNDAFYRYGQTEINPSKRNTPATSRAASEYGNPSFNSPQSGTTMSFNMANVSLASAVQGGDEMAPPASNGDGKRPRRAQVDAASRRNVRPKN